MLRLHRIGMEKRKLGNSGLEVAPLGFGGNVLGWTVDEPTAFNLLDAFVAAGFNLIDTADTYSGWVPGHIGGESETIIGNWLARSGNRRKVVIATKVGMKMPSGKEGLSKSHILASANDSLKRLQTHYIDLYQSHIDDQKTPLEETLAAHAELIKQGKVRAIGASNYTAERLAEALDVSKRLALPRYQSLQPRYNLYTRVDFESKLQALCLRENLGVIPYFALAAGFLTGKYRAEADFTKSERGTRVKDYLNERGFRILAALDKVAKETNSTPGKVALAWLMARPGITAPLASATSLEQLNDLVAAASLKLDAGSTSTLDQASA
jgi:aryl-alcohol dehydrogenase-like predicted oxidoreductase